MAKPEDVAEWMVDELERKKYLDQETAAFQIKSSYGEEYVHMNENGHWGISRKVLAAFKKLTGDTVVWDRGDKLWRYREGYDPGSRQTED